MTELTTDQRLSGQLLPKLSELQEQAGGYRTNAAVLREHDMSEAADMQERLVQNVGAQAGRLAEIIEALAAGTLRIVDEYTLVKTLERVIREERVASERQAPLRAAQLVHQELAKNGAIR